ncbi:putative wsc domain-containing protein [Rosellinia necatrix]|uniref:Putative wsc domain-containing protein n=1 Tax=Rosellinia necatrix TaxID=77044 RepID=A0A1S7UKW4_ROSNE|nr:putative wsc domain-containing protein [Rosellinia necatrix]
MMNLKSLVGLAILGLSPAAEGFWRMECRGSTGTARMDPIVDFNKVSGHAHAVHGSSGFGMASTYDDLVNADCTSCAVKQDKSAYWTPAMYFLDSATNEFTPVPQVGGMLAYYLLRGDNVTAFPAGFQMVAGSNFRRDYTVGDPYSPDPPQSNWAGLKQTGQSDLEQRAVGFNCLNYKQPAEGSLFRHYMPNKTFTDAQCPDGLRLELMFPSCWNGELDSETHKTHVAYPDLVGNGNCPDTHPKRLVTMFFETIWDTNAAQFQGKSGSFVLSNGDRTGFGYHGDFMTGWDPDFLQEAVDTCTNDSGELGDCALFTNNGPLLSEAEQRECKFKTPLVLAAENAVAESMTQLPGGVQIQDGPESATPPSGPIDQVTSLIGNIIGGEAPTTTTSNTPSSTPTPVPTTTTSSKSQSGGAFIEASSAATPSNPDFGVNNIQPTTTSSSSSTSTSSLPTTTPAPPATSEPGVFYEVYSTQTITSAGLVEEIVWMQPVVYVTEEFFTTVTIPGPAPQKLKIRDHAVQHRHNHGRRGH